MDMQARAVYRGQVTKISKTASEYLAAPESHPKAENPERWDEITEELAVLLQRLKTATEGLAKANEQTAVTVKPEDYEREMESIAEYEDKAVTAIARLTVRLEKIQKMQHGLYNNGLTHDRATESQPRKTTQGVKLQKLPLKHFSGDHRDWLPFWEQFRSAIHENPSMSGADKFSYLLTVLEGKAAEAVGGFIPTEKCYETAIGLLQEEFGKNDKLIDKIMQQFMSLQAVTVKSDFKSLRRLYNTVMTSIRSLNALNVPTSHYSLMLKSKLLRCLPHDLRVEFYRMNPENNSEGASDDKDEAKSTASMQESSGSIMIEGDRQLKALLKFIKREAESLENSYDEKESRKPPKMYATATGLLTTDASNRCLFCKSTCHLTSECDGIHTLEQRKDILKQDGRCFRCTLRGHSAKRCKQRRLQCKKCEGRHATTLCDPNYKPQRHVICEESSSTSHVNNPVTPVRAQNCMSLCTASSNVGKEKCTDVYLQTASVSALNKARSKQIFCRLILDGGSQFSYVTERLVNVLNLPSVGVRKLSVVNFGSSEPMPPRLCNIVRVFLKGQHTNQMFTLDAIVVPEICLDVVPVPPQDEFPDLTLADSKIINHSSIVGLSILIGADRYWNFVTGKLKRLKGSLTAVESVFGWTVHGSASATCKVNNITYSFLTYAIDQFDPNSLWDLEAIGIKGDIGEETVVTQQYSENCVKRVNDRCELSLPWKDKQTILHENKKGAFKRLVSLTRRLASVPQKLIEYDQAMREFIGAGFAEKVKFRDEPCTRKYYLPHRPVYREESTTTRLRIVFDASAHEGLNPSLNDLLSPGQNLLPDIFRILINFRNGAIGLVADIEKAFLQIMLCESDRDTHRFFWYASPRNDIENLPEIVTYRINRVTFGVTCSPFMLNVTLQKHFRYESARYPDTAAVLGRCFYVDDLVCATDNVEAALKLHEEANKILEDASMSLRKWNSNEKNVRLHFTNPPIVQKVLGLVWYTQSDELAVDIGPVKTVLNEIPTKRTVLQVIARFYDPLGYLGPFLMRLKILFQFLWRAKQAWDERLRGDLLTIWNSCKQDVDLLENLAIPRCMKDVKTRYERYELHLFADASPKGYGTVAYVRSTNEEFGSVTFLCAKHRVAPLSKNSKCLTLPRLELTAALIATRLAAYLDSQSSYKFSSIYIWSDSRIALAWIKGPLLKWKQYVAHRVKEIKELSTSYNWRYCPGKENPADLLTRGVHARKLIASTFWLEGPEWLSKNQDYWPNEEISTDETIDIEILALAVTADTAPLPVSGTFILERYSSLQKLFRITAYVLRFVHLRKRKPQTGLPSAEEMHQAESFWVKREQLRYFQNEIMALKEQRSLGRSSRILTLNPKLDDKGLLRVGSRLDYAEDEDCRFPILLPKHSHVSYLIILDIHQRTLHSGTNTMLMELRRKYWIQSARQLGKKIINKCRACRQLFSKAATQPFAPLPIERMKTTRAFHTTGLDFAGPLFVLNDKGESQKMYILLLTCATVRAVHLELVKDLTTESFLMALRRFVARRGKPNVIYSDNARTFKRAAKELQNIPGNEKVSTFLSTNQIRWKFIVERAPWWGGFWERLVRSVKNILKANILKNILTVDEMTTLLAEAEGWINARPLTYNSDDPSALSPITPAHFLMGSSISNEAESTPTTSIDSKQIRLMWKARISRTNHIWKRWKEEYLLQLRTLHHTKPTLSSRLKKNDVVLLADQSLPRIAWKLARIEETFVGRDGKIRACLVKLADGTTLRRPIQRLCPLELD